MKDYYKVLQVSTGANEDEIHKAYEKMVSDFESGKQLSEKIDDVEEAYWVLSDPTTRLQYDHFFKSSTGLMKNFDGLDFSKVAWKREESEFFDLNDPGVAEELFKKIKLLLTDLKDLSLETRSLINAFGNKKKLQNEDVCFDLKLNSREALAGGYKAINYACYMKCSDCGGLGSYHGGEWVLCESCLGTAEASAKTSGKEKCLVCAGLGKYPKNNCPKCKGQGRVLASRRAEILVPPRIKNNTLLKVASQGNFGFRNTPSSDLIVRIRVSEKLKMKS